MGLAPGDPRHGTVNGYSNLRCRCDECRKAATNYARERGYGTAWYRRHGVRPYYEYLAAIVPDHGQESRYVQHRCRCDLCKEASRLARARRRAKAAK